jgi:hypothetical protein
MNADGPAPPAGDGERGVAQWLRLAAAPTFAVMALATSLSPGPLERLCSTAPTGPLCGMALMYLLMSIFHLPPWARIARDGRRRLVRASGLWPLRPAAAIRRSAPPAQPGGAGRR